jgi:hypothetical protein
MVHFGFGEIIPMANLDLEIESSGIAFLPSPLLPSYPPALPPSPSRPPVSRPLASLFSPVLLTLSRYSPEKLVLPSKVKQVCCGWFHAVALTEEGTIYVWGKNEDGKLGLGDSETRYRKFLK